MTIQVADPLTANATIDIAIHSTTRANVTVKVTVTDGDGNDDEIAVHLDANGNGSAQWTVPEWPQAIFNDGVCAEQTRAIE